MKRVLFRLKRIPLRLKTRYDSEAGEQAWRWRGKVRTEAAVVGSQFEV
jgi:hypothetical protein